MKAVRYLPILGCLLAAQTAGVITIDYDLVPLCGASCLYDLTHTGIVHAEEVSNGP